MQLHLKGKNVLVTGGSKNIGKAIVRAYLQEGANVVFTWHSDEAAANATYDELCPLAQGYFAAHRADAMREEEVRATFDFCYEAMGGVDVLVNNACSAGRKKRAIQDITPEEWNGEVFAAILPMYLHTRMLCRDCITAKKPCHIINLSAAEGVKICSVPGTAPYAAAKAGIIMYTRTLAHQMAPYGITINGIIPGRVLDADLVGSEAYAHITGETRTGSLKDLADPAEIGAMAAYLGSDLAKHIIGANLDVTGGCLL